MINREEHIAKVEWNPRGWLPRGYRNLAVLTRSSQVKPSLFKQGGPFSTRLVSIGALHKVNLMVKLAVMLYNLLWTL